MNLPTFSASQAHLARLQNPKRPVNIGTHQAKKIFQPRTTRNTRTNSTNPFRVVGVFRSSPFLPVLFCVIPRGLRAGFFRSKFFKVFPLSHLRISVLRFLCAWFTMSAEAWNPNPHCAATTKRQKEEGRM
jgi:hypothetical protein